MIKFDLQIFCFSSDHPVVELLRAQQGVC